MLWWCIEIRPFLIDYYTTKPDVCSDDDDVDIDEIIELLKASSETHSEDNEVWESFKIEIEKRRKDFISGETARKVCEVLFILITHINIMHILLNT